MPFGTLSTLDTLRSSQQTIAQYGEDKAWAAIEASLAAHNAIIRDQVQVSPGVEITTDRQRRYGSAGGNSMEELDEFGTPNPQKVSAGTTVGFPLRKYGRAMQWTRTYFEVATAAELAAQVSDIMDSDAVNIQRQIKRAVFKATNTNNYEDRLVDHVALQLKALVNADGAGIPPGPNAEVFNGSTHTHYLFTAGTSLAAADVNSLVTTVTEHFAMGTVAIYINSAQESAMRALNSAGQFIPITPTQVTPAYTSAAIVEGLDRVNIYNRKIGYWGTNYAEVWIKPWTVAGYLFATVLGQDPPLVMRVRGNVYTTTPNPNLPSYGDLRLMSEDEEHPLRARSYEREFGMGVWNRVNGAALYIDTGSAGAYVSPTI